MKIMTFYGADAPPAKAWIARYYDNGGFLPVVHHGSTEEGVRAAAQTFWDEQQALQQKRRTAAIREGKAPKAEAPFPAAESPAPVDEFADMFG